MGQSLAGSTLHHRLQGIPEAGSNLQTASQLPWFLPSQKDTGYSDMRGNKPSLQYSGQTPRKKSKDFSGLQDLHNVSRMAKPLYEATAGSANTPLEEDSEQKPPENKDAIN